MTFVLVPIVLALPGLFFGSPATAQVSADPRSTGALVHTDSLRSAIEKERLETMEWLRTSPTSYLAAVSRLDFGDRTTLTVGRDASNDMQIDDPAFSDHHLSVTVAGDSFTVSAVDPTATFAVRSEEGLRRRTLPATYIRVGRLSVRLSHQRFPALIVFDPQSPAFASYKGLDYYPVDPAYRFVLDLARNPRPDTVVILSTRGNRRNALREGWFTFSIGNQSCRLEVSRLLEPGVGEKTYSIFFRDKTSGRETYTVGRYLDLEETPDGRFILDFNRAYNPACAISPFYNCPLPPEENRLPVPIPAGEKDAHYTH